MASSRTKPFGAFNRVKSVLVVETDDLATRAVVCVRGAAGHVTCQGWSETKNVAVAEALNELLPALKAQGVEIPSQAILLSPHVHVVALDLPVDPKKPLPRRQFQELLRWEVEPYISQHRARRIGAILVGRGYLSSTDLERLLRETESASGGKPRRLGDCAVESGLVTGEQLTECLALQQSTLVGEGEVAYGWVPQDVPGPNGKWHWSVAAMNDALRRQTVGAFAGHGLRLRAIYPLVGCACAGLNGQADGACAVFEYQSGHLGYTRCAKKRVVTRRSLFTQEFHNPIRACTDMFEPDARQIWLAGRWPDLDGAVRELETCLGRPCLRFLPDSQSARTNPANETGLAGVMGAAGHLLGCADGRLAVAVPARDPQPPLWKNRRALTTAAAAIASLMLLGAAVRLKKSSVDTTEIVQARRVLAELQAEGARLNTQAVSLEKSALFLQQSLPAKQQQAAQLLEVLRESCSDEIMLKRISFVADGEVELQGWGLTAQGIQKFKLQLQDKLRNFVLSDEAKPIRREEGWHKLPGYGFEVRLKADASLPARKCP